MKFTIWLFSKFYVSVNSSCYYIYSGISLETPVFWLGTFLTFDQKFISEGGCSKDVLVCIFRNKLVARQGDLFRTREYLSKVCFQQSFCFFLYLREFRTWDLSFRLMIKISTRVWLQLLSFKQRLLFWYFL